MAYERIEIVQDDPTMRPPSPPPTSLISTPAPPGPNEPYPLAIPGSRSRSSGASPFAPLAISAEDASDGAVSIGGDGGGYDKGFNIVLIRPDEMVEFEAAAASELPRGEVGFLAEDGALEIPDWDVVFVPEGAEGSGGEASSSAIDQLESELRQPTAAVEFDKGELSLPVEEAEGLGEPDRAPTIAAVIDGTPHCEACDDLGSDAPDVGVTAPLPDCEADGWLSIAVSGAVLPGSNRALAAAQIERAREVYDQCCIQVDVVELEYWDDDQASEVLGGNLYLDEESILQDMFGFFELSDEQLGLLEHGVTPESGEPVPVWWVRRTRSSEVGYVMRDDRLPERTVVISGGLEPDYESNNIVLAHEIGHVLLEGQLNRDHHDYMHPRNLMAAGRLNTGFGELTAAQCGWMRGSPYLR